LPHYYETLLLAFNSASNDTQRKSLFDLLWKTIAASENNNASFREMFVRNAFSEKVTRPIKDMLAKFFRECADKETNDSHVQET
jgi:hypothetical protein